MSHNIDAHIDPIGITFSDGSIQQITQVREMVIHRTLRDFGDIEDHVYRDLFGRHLSQKLDRSFDQLCFGWVG